MDNKIRSIYGYSKKSHIMYYVNKKRNFADIIVFDNEKFKHRINYETFLILRTCSATRLQSIGRLLQQP